MPIDSLQMLDVIEVMENFLDFRRPPEHIRHQVDLAYRVEELSVFIFELRPRWDKPEDIREARIAKATWVKERQHWKIFWPRANKEWEPYKTVPFVGDLREFTRLVDEDKDSCFWG